MKTASVRDLKARLSAYLREVQRGETLLVTSNDQVVAELRPPTDGTLEQAPLRFRRLVAAGALRLATGASSADWTTSPKKPAPPGTAQALIDEERGE